MNVDLKRAKELIKTMITDYQEGCVSGEPLSDDDVINYLFTLDFTEEELLELGFSEEAIDSANENNMSNGFKKFKVFIEETVCEEFEVRADDLEEAEEIARKKYKNGEFVLEMGNVTSKQMMIEEPNGTQTEWFEF